MDGRDRGDGYGEESERCSVSLISLELVHRTKKRRLRLTHRDHAVPLHYADLDVLRSRLDDLEQRLDGELDRLLPVELLGVVLLEELADGLGRPADGAGLDLSAMAPG
jgi:hypothetical protein